MEIFQLGHQYDNHFIQEKIGEGSFGVVYRAEEVNTKNSYALKALKIALLPEDVRQNLEKRFELEYLTGKIESNHLVRTHYMSKYDNVPYFTMDFCNGGNLQHKLKTVVPTLDKSIPYAKGILQGLQDLHRNGKIHRDLKPENVLFDKNDIPKLTDFGISGHINIQLTCVNSDDSPEHIIGSYAYMAPEQLRSVKRQNTLLPTVDIFAFGVLCYEMFTGRLPFGPWKYNTDVADYLERSAKGDMDDPRKYNENISYTWSSTLKKCLHPDRELRFQTVEEVLNTVEIESASVMQKIKFNGIAEITLVYGDELNKVYSLKKSEKSIYKIGRALENDIVIIETNTSFISRHHCTLELNEDSIYIRDGQWEVKEMKWNSSKNGTYVNGKRVDQKQGFQLQNEDIVYLGNSIIKINFKK